MQYKVIHLPKKEWKDTIIPICYTTDLYYDVEVLQKEQGFHVNLEKKSFKEPVSHTPEAHDYPDKLYADHWENAYAWGVLVEGALIAAIETCSEEWSNRLRITELFVDPNHQKQGIGRSLMDMAKEQARREKRRALILETQSCNVNAIDFYLHEGFTLIGFDACAYTNEDLAKKEVRLELGWFPPRKKR